MTKEVLQSKLANVKLRKIKSKMIVEALMTGASVHGNHQVEFVEVTSAFTFTVFYRGTAIALVAIHKKNYKKDYSMYAQNINAGIYDNTPSTIRQRRDIIDAVDELIVALC